MTHVAPRIVNSVSCVTRINHEINFVAGALFGDVELSLFVAGAVFGDVEVSLFVAGAAFGEIWNDSRSAKCCIFQ